MDHSVLDRRSRYSIRVIREALFKLLEKKPLEEITVVEICRTADVNRGTFYKYYRDVPDLYNKTEDALADELYSLIPDREEISFTPQYFFRDVLNILMENREFIYITKNKQFSERLAQKLLAFFCPYIRQMIQANHPGSSDTDILFLTEYILGGCTRVVIYWLDTNMQMSVERMEKILSSVVQQSLMFQLEDIG